MADIFISYSSKDSERALSLAEELRSRGASVWIDQQAIDGATQWSSEIAQALDECKALVLLISKSSLKSKNCAKEVTIAAEADKFILPIDLEDIPLPKEFKYHLAGLQRVAFSNQNAIWRSVEKLLSLTPVETRHGASLPPVKDTVIRVAVLPFDDLSPKKDNGWFADGMMDELIGTLSSLEKLRVASRPDVMYYKKHRPKAKKIADDLKVRYLIEGSVRKAGEKIRITVSLTDTAFGEQLWMNNYDGTFDDIFEFQETVSKQILEALELKLTPQAEKVIQEQPTQNVEAYELYLKGLESHRLYSREGYEKALKLYESAIVLDPRFSDAYLVLANLNATYYRESSRDPKWLLRAEEYFKKAEAITGETVKTLRVKGEIAWLKENFEEAEQVLLQAIERDPNYYKTYNMIGNVYVMLDKKDLAAKAFSEVLKITKHYQGYSNLISTLSGMDEETGIKQIALEALPIMQKHLLEFHTDYAVQSADLAFLPSSVFLQPVNEIKRAQSVKTSTFFMGILMMMNARIYEENCPFA